jgi:hypothetical protein
VDDEDLTVGIAKKEMDLMAAPKDNHFWGYECLTYCF